MPATLDSAHQIVTDLIHTFQQNHAHFLSPCYQEAEARKDFIDKFFVALGWDVNHDVQINPAEQEVKIELGVTGTVMQKRADYAFYFAPNHRDVRFFVEARKPSADLNANADAYFQTLRHGWNAQTPLAVLTDFEQFHILDCRAKPDIHIALQRAHKTYCYTEFLDREKFAEVYWLFSRQALAEGAFDRAIAGLPTLKAGGKKKSLLRASTQSVDASFLDELEQHRKALAKSLKRDNPLLDGLALTEVTQRVLDRLVFLRFLEDKLIETEVSVAGFARSAAPWAKFIGDSRKLNARYNGAVYKPHPLIDAGRLAVRDADFRDACAQLSDQHSPFDFNAIPIHILGSIYERFLGKVIVTTDKRARVEEKPEVRKAGGVYYTPEYIVRYIVDQTVGKLIENKTPAEIAKLRFADIACGSGGFLLGVYDLLLRHHTHWFNEHPHKAGKAGCIQTSDGVWRLSQRQRREILTNNIFGVDIDQQAVEVTQMSLYLKLLEDETTASSHQHEIQLHNARLPNLSNNIKCGNSLVGTDILSGQMFTTDEALALNAMDFVAAFPAVMKAGGFDAIVGNPPYGAELSEIVKRYFSKHFKLGTTDTAALMIQRALNLAKPIARVGLIVPKSLTYSSTWQRCRASSLAKLETLVDVGKAWKEVKLEQVICILAGESASYTSLQRRDNSFVLIGDIPKSAVAEFGFWLNGLSTAEVALGRKIAHAGVSLSAVAANSRGGMFQDSVSASEGNIKVIGGKQIARYTLREPKGFVESKAMLSPNAFVIPGSVLVQNIVAHIENPIDHIKIIATLVREESADQIVILDTINQLRPTTNHSGAYLLALLHSKLINWYVYRFVYAKAIRTMHFDATSTNRIPIRAINFNDAQDKAKHDRMVQLVTQMLDAKQKQAGLDRQIDALVYDLYGLTDGEIAIVEAG